MAGLVSRACHFMRRRVLANDLGQLAHVDVKVVLRVLRD